MHWLQAGRLGFKQAVNMMRGDQGMEALASSASVQRIFWTAPVMALGNFLAAVSFWLNMGSPVGTELVWRQLIITTNFSVSAISALIWFLAWQMKRRVTSVRLTKFFVYGVASYVLAVGLVLSLIDQLVLASITPFLLCVTIVGTFYYLPPRSSLVLFAAAYLVFSRALPLGGGRSASVVLSNQVNALTTTALGFALSLLTWIHFRRTTLQERTIKGQQAKLEKLAYQDSLTGLPNRRFLDELIKREVALVNKQAPAALVMCDIDHFKKINDTYGHLAGDDLLRELALLLQDNIRASNTLVRLGGEEFIVFSPSTSLEEGALLAERLRRLVEGHEFTVGENPVWITMSIGVAALTGSENIRDYYNRADQALYDAKEQGRNRVVVASGTAS